MVYKCKFVAAQPMFGVIASDSSMPSPSVMTAGVVDVYYPIAVLGDRTQNACPYTIGAWTAFENSITFFVSIVLKRLESPDFEKAAAFNLRSPFFQKKDSP